MENRKIISNKKRTILKIFKGVKKIYDLVKITLGPKGRNVIIEKRFGTPFITKDGVTVAKDFFLKNKLENLGAQLIKEVALKTNDCSGDGTTTATVLAYSIIKNGIKYLTLGFSSEKIKNEISFFVRIVIKKLLKNSRPIKNIKDIRNVSTISSNNDPKIGNMISKAMKKLGMDGIITVEEGKSIKDELKIVNGMKIDSGYISHYFLRENSEKIILENSYILLISKKISNFREIIKILEKVSKKGDPLLIVANDFESDIIAALVLNSMRGILKVVAIKTPSFGEKKRSIIEDISILTSSKIMGRYPNDDLSKIKIRDLGKVDKVEISKEETIIIKKKKNKNKIKKRILFLKEKIKNEDSNFEIEKLKERISKFNSGIGIIKVGGVTETEVIERKFRIEDSLNATRAAIEEGILPGAGVALLRVSNWLKRKYKNSKKKIGLNIIRKSIIEPFKQILKNCSITPKIILSKIKSRKNTGFNVVKKKFCNLLKEGVIDPVKVIKSALLNASSISCLILTTGGAICSYEKINLNKE
ncbi:Heat shock protein 60 family chaperone GroEL [Candidatus Vidania fulgoroideae]|nr:Heat shock protein 60 family chaperone GroEL [Candidatus Vidania fulgoroideae]